MVVNCYLLFGEENIWNKPYEEAVLEKEIWIYWSESNSRFMYIYILILIPTWPPSFALLTNERVIHSV